VTEHNDEEEEPKQYQYRRPRWVETDVRSMTDKERDRIKRFSERVRHMMREVQRRTMRR
jgi:hypothetical protein